jgi:hypothetical protein
MRITVSQSNHSATAAATAVCQLLHLRRLDACIHVLLILTLPYNAHRNTVSQAITPLPIEQVAKDAGVLDEELELYGSSKGKVKLDVLDRLSGQEQGRYVVVGGITPTPLGEGKRYVVRCMHAVVGLKSVKSVPHQLALYSTN